MNEIERQLALFEHAAQVGESRPSLNEMIRAILEARHTDDLVRRTVTADVYVCTHVGTRFFFELKSPVPNKGQCLEVTQRLLRIHLLTTSEPPDVQAYFAMAYNPYGPDRNDYRWTYPKNYMPFDEAVLIGQEFWELIGGPTAYSELLDIYYEVGREKAKFILDTLAFGF